MLCVMQEYPLETRVFAWDDSIIYIISFNGEWS